MYKIWGEYQGSVELIDSFDTEEEALSMLKEYQKAYGTDWTLRVERTENE